MQVLKQSGYTGYLFCRPDAQHLPLASDDFLWVGYDGSALMAHRCSEHYNSARGRARARVEQWLRVHAGDDDGVLLWGEVLPLPAWLGIGLIVASGMLASAQSRAPAGQD